MRTFFCEVDADIVDIEACVADGMLEPWRVDAFGRQWYRRKKDTGTIRGVPKTDGLEADEDGDDDDE
jgi:hypothetical protein